MTSRTCNGESKCPYEYEVLTVFECRLLLLCTYVCMHLESKIQLICIQIHFHMY